MRFAPFFLLCLAGCAGVSSRPQPLRPTEPVLERGWSYVESERDFLAQDAGVGATSYSAPVIASEKLIFGSDRFGITVLAKRNGQLLWQRRIADGVAAHPFADDNFVYIGSEGGILHKFEIASGRPVWNVTLSGPVHGAMISAFQRLYVGTEDEAIHAVDPGTGKVLWTYRRPAFTGTAIRGGGSPAAIAGKIWMGFSDGALVALDPDTGAVDTERQYRDNLKFTDIDARIVSWKDGLLVSTYDGKLRYMKRDGTAIWEFPVGSARAPLVTEGEIVYLPSSEGTIYAISGGGREMWRYSLKRGVPTGMGLASKNGRRVLVVATSEDKVVALDAADGSSLGESSLGRGSGSYAPVVVDETDRGISVYLLSAYSRVHQFRLNL